MATFGKKVLVVVFWVSITTLVSSCAPTFQFVPIDSTAGDTNKCRVYVMRHKSVLFSAATVEVRHNNVPVGALGNNGYLSWMCDTTRVNKIEWFPPEGTYLWVDKNKRQLTVCDKPGDHVYIDIHPDGRYQQLNTEEGQSTISSMSAPKVVGRGYSFIEDPSVGIHKGYVEFYEPDDGSLWPDFSAQRKGADQRILKRTEINQFRGLKQRLRMDAPPGQQTFFLKVANSNWEKTADVTVKEGFVTPVRVNFDIINISTHGGMGIPFFSEGKTETTTFIGIVVVESPVEKNTYDKQLLCK